MGIKRGNANIYASERPENVQIIAVKTFDDMKMLLTFSNGEQRLFDASILNGPAFAPLTDEKILKIIIKIKQLFLTDTRIFDTIGKN